VDKIMTAMDPDAFEIDETFIKIPFKTNGNSFTVDMEVGLSKNLTINGTFLFDMGFGGTISFTGETTRKYRLDTLGGEHVKYVLDWRVVNSLRSYAAVIRGNYMQLDNFKINEPTLEYYTDTIGILGKTSYLGLLGNRFFQNFDVIIDFPSKELYMRPNNQFNKRMKMKDLGIGFVDRTDVCDGFIVRSITVGSKAERDGVRIGDIITHLNDKAVKSDSEKLEDDLYQNPGKETLFTFKRGDSTFKLSLVLEEKLK
jgi:hypothetical protein